MSNRLRAASGPTGSVTQKHWLALRRYSTPRKLFNMALCEVEKRLRVARPRSMPYAATIDVTNACNLRCPGCPTGVGIQGRPKTLLSAEHLRRFLDEMSPYLLIANLYNWGETLLHREAGSIVAAFHDADIFTSISSNMIVKFEAIESVCDAGLDHLIISADGATRASYPIYRVGGDFDLLVENIKKTVELRRRRGRKTPIIEWQVLAFRHLEHELEQARALAAELGVDWFNVKSPTAPPAMRVQGLEEKTDKNRATDGNCGLLWHSVTLQSDGGIGPCCYLYEKADDFGHIDSSTVREARLAPRYVGARELFDPSSVARLDPSQDHPCLRCPIVHHQPHLREFLAASPHAFVEENFMGILTKRADHLRTWVGMEKTRS